MDINTNIIITFFLAALEMIGKCYITVARFFTSCNKEQLTQMQSAVIEKQAARMEWYYTIAEEEHHGGEFVAAFAVQRALLEDLLKVFHESKLSYGTQISSEFQRYWMDVCGKTVRQAKEICEVAAAK